ncbi:MAG TPA: AAA family ATPase, partial [Hyphomonas sp.]|nr:AAA family ATPase [Hyphomonas sp.]
MWPEWGGEVNTLLIERDSQLAALRALADRAGAGKGHIVLVSGEAGIGKTSLIRSFLSSAPAAWRAGLGGCDALFTPRPLGPVHDTIEVLGPDVGSLLQSGADRQKLYGALLAALAEGQGPVILVWEDVHWADFATLDLLRYLGRRISLLPVLLVLTFRGNETGENHPLTQAIRDLPETSLTEMQLPPLSARAVGQLARRAGLPGDRLFQATSGNPFEVSEMLAAREAGAEALPSSVREAVTVRQSRLTAEARDFLEVLSVIPAAVPAGLAAALAPGSSADMIRTLTEGGVLQASASGDLRFRHEIARLATFDRIPAARKRVLHARILDALRGLGSAAHLDQMVHHA